MNSKLAHMIQIMVILFSANFAYSAELISANKASETVKKIRQSDTSECVKEWNDFIAYNINEAVNKGSCDTVLTFMAVDCITSRRIYNKTIQLERLGYIVTRIGPDGLSYDVSWCK